MTLEQKPHYQYAIDGLIAICSNSSQVIGLSSLRYEAFVRMAAGVIEAVAIQADVLSRSDPRVQTLVAEALIDFMEAVANVCETRNSTRNGLYPTFSMRREQLAKRMQNLGRLIVQELPEVPNPRANPDDYREIKLMARSLSAIQVPAPSG